MTEVREIKQSDNEGLAVGVLSEKRYEIIDDTLNDGTPCKTIRGNIVLDLGNNSRLDLGFYEKSMFLKEHKESFRYNDIKKAMENYVSVADNNGEPTLVSAEFTVRHGKPYLSQRTNKATDSISFNVSRLRTLAEASEKRAEGMISGILLRKQPEVFGENETGRLLITIGLVTYGQKFEPYDIIVDTDLAEAFDGMYNLNDIGCFDYAIRTTHVGAVKTVESKGLGRQAKVESGYDKTEWILIGASDPYNDEMEEYFTRDDVNPLIENRKIEFEKVEKGEGSKPTSKAKSEGLKARTVKSEIKDDELPF